jgi:Zn-dependent protease
LTIEDILPRFIILILSLSFHEAAHAWTSDRLGDPTARMLGRITMNPMAHIDWIGTVLFPLVAMFSGLPLIGWAKPVPVSWQNLKSPRRDFAVVAAAGPISNLVLAFGAAAILMAVPGGGSALAADATTLGGFLTLFVVTNVLLAVFNMVPVPPLDGGNVISGIVPEPIARAIDMLRPYGFILLYALMLTGVLWTIIEPVFIAIIRWLL